MRFILKGGNKVNDVVVIERNQNEQTIAYARFERLYESEFNILRNTIQESNIIVNHIKNNIELNTFLNMIYDFEIENNKSKNRVFALSYTILLPRLINTKEKKIAYIKEFRKLLLPDVVTYLNYFVIEEKKGKGTYLRLIVFERTLIDKEIVQRYKTPVYTYKKVDGERIQIKTREAKQIKRDRSGKKIKKYVAFSDKLRFFNFKNTSELREKFISIIETALKKVFTVRYIDKLRFKRKKVWGNSNRFKIAVAIAINHTKEYIEVNLNKHYCSLKRILDNVQDRHYHFTIERIQMAVLLKIYYEIESIFENNLFKVEEKEAQINYKYIKLPELKENLIQLTAYFNRKMQEFESKFQKF